MLSRRTLWHSPLSLLAVVVLSLVVLCTEALAAKQVFVYNNRYLPASLDPAKVSDVYAHNVLNQVFEGLTANDPRDFSAVPGVAERWQISKSGKTYTFYLNPKAVWSDGTRVTAEDFVFAWRQMIGSEIIPSYLGGI